MRCFEIKMVSGKAVSLFVPMVLLGCSTMPLGAGDALAQPVAEAPVASQSDMDSQLMFELMIAELAGRRGQLDVAMAGYLSASERTDDPRVSERATRLALFGRQWAEAETAARRWMDLDPDNSEAPRLLGQTLLHQDKVEEAVGLFSHLLRATGEPRQLLRSIQFELQQNKNPATSIAVMQEIVEAFDNEPEAHLGLARAHITNADPASALDSTAGALRVSPVDTDALLLRAQILGSMGRTDEAFSLLQEALQSTPENTNLRLGYAQLLVDGERNEEVLQQLDTIRAQSGANSDNLLAISMLAMESGHLDKAEAYLTELQVSGVYPDQSNFYLGRISDDQEAYEDAIAYYDEVGEGDLYFNSQVRAAELTALTGDLEKSRSRLQQLAANVSDSLLQTRLVAVESRILQVAEQNEEAVSVLSEGLQRFPDNADLLYARALAAQSAGDTSTMIADLNQLIALDSDNAHALNALGYYYADENIELERADELLVKANALLPQDPAIIDSLGWLRFRQGNYVEAIKLLRTAYELYPDPEIAAHLGAALWSSGAREEAQTLIDKALESDPDDKRLLDVKNDTFK